MFNASVDVLEIWFHRRSVWWCPQCKAQSCIVKFVCSLSNLFTTPKWEFCAGKFT